MRITRCPHCQVLSGKPAKAPFKWSSISRSRRVRMSVPSIVRNVERSSMKISILEFIRCRDAPMMLAKRMELRGSISVRMFSWPSKSSARWKLIGKSQKGWKKRKKSTKRFLRMGRTRRQFCSKSRLKKESICTRRSWNNLRMKTLLKNCKKTAQKMH